ncbi:hypothetical protein [Aquamicrobium sp.]|uniref:hypothetical protein n=1 Tax=Aquamicrobium sp. TaxID=1872579 RepID=UPI002587D8EC|nr:hypothetical protein [Aquamicrobium sp.]MCK9552334.1 hypothetical protein [Aquamicrobium sp.]
MSEKIEERFKKEQLFVFIDECGMAIEEVYAETHSEAIRSSIDKEIDEHTKFYIDKSQSIA